MLRITTLGGIRYAQRHVCCLFRRFYPTWGFTTLDTRRPGYHDAPGVD